jgi:flagella basal body P-ring formation protein FlgA
MTGTARSLVLLGLLALLPSIAEGQTLYLTSRPISGGQTATLADLCASGPAGQDGISPSVLAAPLPALASEPSVVPARDVSVIIAPAVRQSVVLVGGPVIYVPKSVTDPQTVHFYEALLQHLAPMFPDDRIEVTISNGAQPDFSGIEGELQFRLPAGASSPRALTANTFVEYRGSRDRQWRDVPIRVRVFVLTPVAAQRIAYGQTFTSVQVAYGEIEASSLAGRPAALAGGRYEALAAISAGQPILGDMIKVLYDVRSGEQLKIRFNRGNISVTVPGIAYTAGSVGDKVSISTLAGSQRFTGTIVTPTEVVVEE